jgi:ribosome-binding protein aMBF1 (putative translation factor)
MKTPNEIRLQRVTAEIPARTLAAKANIHPSRLSPIERVRLQPTADELIQLDRILSELIRAKDTVREIAAAVAWPAGVG